MRRPHDKQECPVGAHAPWASGGEAESLDATVCGICKLLERLEAGIDDLVSRDRLPERARFILVGDLGFVARTAARLGAAVDPRGGDGPGGDGELFIGMPLVYTPPGSDCEVEGNVTGFDGETFSFIDADGKHWAGVDARAVGLLGPPEDEDEDEPGTVAAAPYGVEAGPPAPEGGRGEAEPQLLAIAARFAALHEGDLLGRVEAHLAAIEASTQALIDLGVFPGERGGHGFRDAARALRRDLASFGNVLPEPIRAHGGPCTPGE